MLCGGDSICSFLVWFLMGKLIEQTRCCSCSLRVYEITRLFLQGQRCLYRCYANVGSVHPHTSPQSRLSTRRLDQSEARRSPIRRPASYHAFSALPSLHDDQGTKPTDLLLLEILADLSRTLERIIFWPEIEEGKRKKWGTSWQGAAKGKDLAEEGTEEGESLFEGQEEFQRKSGGGYDLHRRSLLLQEVKNKIFQKRSQEAVAIFVRGQLQLSLKSWWLVSDITH